MKTILFLLALLASPALRADPPKKVSPAAMARSREHFKKGQAFHAAGKYDEAVAEYRAAYQEAPLPDLLFNLAQVQRLKGDKQGALDSYLAYLDQSPNGRGADESRVWAASLTKELREEEEARRQRDAAEAERQRAEREAQRAADAKRQAELEAKEKALATPPPPPRGQGLKIAGIATGAAGVVALGLGTYFALHAKSLSDDQKNLTEYDPGLVSDGKAANRNAIIAFSIGGAAVVTGGVLYYLGVRAAHAPVDVAVVPAVAPGQAGLAAFGRF